jgi:hypothetical protein
VNFLTRLLAAERVRRGTRAGTRALPARDQAILVLRWFLDATRMRQLAGDNQISVSTGYDYLHEGIDVLAARSPTLTAPCSPLTPPAHDYVTIGGTLIATDRCRTPGPTEGVDLWWSGKHDQHRGNVQVVGVPDGWPIWTAGVRPGREHDTTAVRARPEILLALTQAATDLRTLGDLGYQGVAGPVPTTTAASSKFAAFGHRILVDRCAPSSIGISSTSQIVLPFPGTSFHVNTRLWTRPATCAITANGSLDADIGSQCGSVGSESKPHSRLRPRVSPSRPCPPTG